MEGIDWNQLAAQSGILIGVGGFFFRMLWGKVRSEIKETVGQSEKNIEDACRLQKKEIYEDINRIGHKMHKFDIELELQKQTDHRHDKELEAIRNQHLALDTRFNSVVEKIFNQINELKDLIVNKYIK